MAEQTATNPPNGDGQPDVDAILDKIGHLYRLNTDIDPAHEVTRLPPEMIAHIASSARDALTDQLMAKTVDNDVRRQFVARFFARFGVRLCKRMNGRGSSLGTPDPYWTMTDALLVTTCVVPVQLAAECPM